MTMVAATTPRGTSAAPAARPGVRKPWYKVLYIQVLTAIVLGAIIGWLFPEFAKNDWIRAMGDGFVKLIKMVIAPIIFCTVVSGIAHISEVRKVGRVAVKALVYFEIVSTFALALGLIVGNVLHPGAGFSGKADAGAVATYAKQASEMKSVDFVLHIIPDSVVGAFAQGEILQVLLFSVLFGFCADGARRQRRSSTHVCRRCRACDVRRNRTDRKSGANRRVWRNGLHDRPLRPQALGNLAGLIATFYLTAGAFVFLVLGTIAWFAGFSILKYLRYIKDELLIVLGTSSSESALPQLMEKLERLGCSKPVVGLVVPTGYSFNLDGTNIYMTLATLFIAQALGVSLSFGEQMTILIVAMLTSKAPPVLPALASSR